MWRAEPAVTSEPSSGIREELRKSKTVYYIYKENLEKGINCSIEEIEENLRKRDYIDSHREFAPLKKAEDSFVLDTSNMTIDEAVNAIIKIVKNKLGEVK